MFNSFVYPKEKENENRIVFKHELWLYTLYKYDKRYSV